LIDEAYHKRLEAAVSDLEYQVSTLRGAYRVASEENTMLRNKSFNQLQSVSPRNGSDIHVIVMGSTATGKSTIVALIDKMLADLDIDHEAIFLDGETNIPFLQERVVTLKERNRKVKVIEKSLRR